MKTTGLAKTDQSESKALQRLSGFGINLILCYNKLLYIE